MSPEEQRAQDALRHEALSALQPVNVIYVLNLLLIPVQGSEQTATVPIITSLN